MSIFTVAPVRPGQALQTGDIDALFIDRFTGVVEGTIARRSAIAQSFPKQVVKGTNTITKKAVGETTLGVLTPGAAPDGAGVGINKNSLTVDTVIHARNIFPLLESIQNDFDAQKAVGEEHGKKFAKFMDQAFFIQALKAAIASASSYGNVDGFSGGTKITMSNAADVNDPVKLYAKIKDMWAAMAVKDVDVVADDVYLYLPPTVYYTLLDNDFIVKGEYLTSADTRIEGHVFKHLGVPVKVTNNIPQTHITTHELGSNYTGNFTKAVCVALSNKALLAGETIALQSDLWFNKEVKCWFLDSWCSFGVTPDRNEYASALYIP